MSEEDVTGLRFSFKHGLAPLDEESGIPFQMASRLSAMWIAFLLLSLLGVSSSKAQTYTSNPSVGTYKNVGFAYKMKVTSISGSNVTFRIDPATPPFGSAGRAVVRMDSKMGTLA